MSFCPPLVHPRQWISHLLMMSLGCTITIYMLWSSIHIPIHIIMPKVPPLICPYHDITTPTSHHSRSHPWYPPRPYSTVPIAISPGTATGHLPGTPCLIYGHPLPFQRDPPCPFCGTPLPLPVRRDHSSRACVPRAPSQAHARAEPRSSPPGAAGSSTGPAAARNRARMTVHRAFRRGLAGALTRFSWTRSPRLRRNAAPERPGRPNGRRPAWETRAEPVGPQRPS